LPASQNRPADFEQARVALITPPRPVALLGSATQLFVADHCQNCPQLFVVSDRAPRIVKVENGKERLVIEEHTVGRRAVPLHTGPSRARLRRGAHAGLLADARPKLMAQPECHWGESIKTV
jgi:hypothetical protein